MVSRMTFLKVLIFFNFFGQRVKNPVLLRKSDLSEKNLFSAKISENFISDFSSEKFIFKLNDQIWCRKMTDIYITACFQKMSK